MTIPSHHNPCSTHPSHLAHNNTVTAVTHLASPPTQPSQIHDAEVIVAGLQLLLLLPRVYHFVMDDDGCVNNPSRPHLEARFVASANSSWHLTFDATRVTACCCVLYNTLVLGYSHPGNVHPIARSLRIRGIASPLARDV